MTEVQIEAIKAFADNNMNVKKTAASLGKSASTVYTILHTVRKSTGKDPVVFRDLNDLLAMAKRGEKKKNSYVLTCKVCGGRFEAPKPQYRVCSDRCRAIAKAKTAANQAENRAAYMRGYRESMAEYEKKYGPSKDGFVHIVLKKK